MPELDSKSLADLPSSIDSWVFGIMKLRSWIKGADHLPYRPYLYLIADERSGFILYTSIEEEATTEKAQEALFSAMLQPRTEFKVVPFRPRQVKFSDRKFMQALKPGLEEIGIRAGYIGNFPLINQFARELEERMREGYPEIPGLLAQHNVTTQMVAFLFSAAGVFYRAAPWVQLSNEDVLSIQVSGQKDPYL